MKTYKEKLNKLFCESKNIDYDKLNTLTNLADGENGYYKDIHNDLTEFNDWSIKFMRKWGIGRYINKNKWGPRRYQQINNVLQNWLFTDKKVDDKDVKKYDDVQAGDVDKTITVVQPPKNHFDLKDDIEKKAKGTEFSDYDFSRIARTETARIKSIYQLLGFKEMGLKYVIHKTRNDAKVGEDHKKYNNREFEIDYLLSKQGDKDRIPNRPNCRCRYQPSMKGVQ